MRQRGFTLVEALIVTALLMTALWSCIGLSRFLDNSRRDAALGDLLASASYARSQAISRGTRITLCPSPGLQSCDRSGRWEQGWIVFADGDNPGVVDGSEQILRQRESLPSGFQLRGNGNLASRISFSPLGTSLGFAGTMTLCDRRGFGSPPDVHARQLRLSTGGRLRVVVPQAAGSCT